MKKKQLLKIGIIIFVISIIILVSSFYYYIEISTIAHQRNVDEKDLEEQQKYANLYVVILVFGAILAWIGGFIMYKNYPPIEEGEKDKESYNLPTDSGFKCPLCEGEVKFDTKNSKWYCIDCNKYL